MNRDTTAWQRGRGRFWVPASPVYAVAAITRMRRVLDRAQARNPLSRRYP